jgi:hypothetical protein
MSKKPWKCFSFSILLLILACAPKPSLVPPGTYEGRTLTLDEIIAKAGDDIHTLKAITDISIEKNNEPHSFLNASVLIQQPGSVHMRIYQLGILVRDFVIKDNILYVLSGKNDPNLLSLGTELYNAIFWWDGYRKGILEPMEKVYRIRAEDKEISVDRTTLLPLTQHIRYLNKDIWIKYTSPSTNDDLWYPSLVRIKVDDFRFTVKIKKLIKNPALGEFDFRTPAGS